MSNFSFMLTNANEINIQQTKNFSNLTFTGAESEREQSTARDPRRTPPMSQAQDKNSSSLNLTLALAVALTLATFVNANTLNLYLNFLASCACVALAKVYKPALTSEMPKETVRALVLNLLRLVRTCLQTLTVVALAACVIINR